MTKPRKLIEVAMPIKEVSAECVRDDRIQHGHISSLHKWWARRPLPVCRAVVFASLVPDPLDVNCPQAVRDAVKMLLDKQDGLDPYKPYDDIPYTAIKDPMDDNLRNRLLMFIGKFSEKYIENEKVGKKTDSKDLLSNYSLTKWDNKNSDEIIGKARKLIWVSHNAKNGDSASDLLAEFEAHYKAIKDAEHNLYITPDRHIESDEVKQKETKLRDAIEAFLDRMPKVFDPFAGGGAIPLEASRLGCRTFCNDINPVAHIIQKGSLEFPQKYGKPIVYSPEEFVSRYGPEEFRRIPNENRLLKDGRTSAVQIDNRLAFDVDFYTKELLKRTEAEIGHCYPADENGKRPIAYYWARVGTCSNPTCRAEVPLLKGFYLANKPGKKVYLKPIIDGKDIDFVIAIGEVDTDGWIHSRKNLRCPICGNNTTSGELKEQFVSKQVTDRLLAVIDDSESGKIYRVPTKKEQEIVKVIPKPLFSINEKLPFGNKKQFDLCAWGFLEWGQLFSSRQLYAMNSLVQKLNELKDEFNLHDKYDVAVLTYLGIWVDRMAARMTSFGLIDLGGEKVVDLFGRQAIPMVFDFPELNILRLEQSSWITRICVSEGIHPFWTDIYHASSGEKEQFSKKYLTAVVTDPPYYDSIAYADLSDFFYVWLKRTLGEIYPSNFATPQTPKSDECTALRYHHGNDLARANAHFERKLLEIFDAIEHQTTDVVSIMFAHQSTEAWTTLCNSIIGARLNITGTWAIDTEKKGGLKEAKAFLSSSVTVACKPAIRSGFGEFRNVNWSIGRKVEQEVTELYSLGFRGADLLTACFGKAVGEFGKYEKVEKADGSEVTVAELLKMTRESAFNALLKGFKGDDFTKFYIGWLELNGFAETDFDDAALFTRISMPFNVNELFSHEIFVKNGNKQSLADFAYRNEKLKNLGEKPDSTLIDKAHRAMWLYKSGNRPVLLNFLSRVSSATDSTFWRVLTSLDELLPKGMDDQKQVAGLIDNKENLLREVRAGRSTESAQQGFEFGDV